MKPYKLLLADADDTLLDFHAAEGKALLHACAAMGIEPSEAEQMRYREINASLWHAYERREVTQEALRVLRFEKFLKELGLSHSAEAMADAFLAGLSLQTDEIAGARDLMERVAAQGIRIIIVTNGIASVQRARFSRSPLAKWVDGMVISGEQGFQKPDPRMVQRGLEMAGCRAEEALMLGDEPRSDIAAANAAGVDSCWLNETGRPNATDHLPTYTIQALQELPKILYA